MGTIELEPRSPARGEESVEACANDAAPAGELIGLARALADRAELLCAAGTGYKLRLVRALAHNIVDLLEAEGRGGGKFGG